MDVDTIIEDFEALEPGEERYRYLIDLGKRLGGLPEAAKVEANRVHGCLSNVWIVAEIRNGHLHLQADSDAFIVRGLIAIVLAIFDGQPVDRVVATDANAVFERIGLDQHLSMGRRNGLWSMVQRVQALARAA